jgi:hypothetical protein
VVRVHYDEGIANHIGPEPCAGIGEASVGERTGQPLSRDRKLIPGADAVCVAEGNMSKSANHLLSHASKLAQSQLKTLQAMTPFAS